MLWGVMPQAGFAQVRDVLYQTGDPLTSLTGKTLTGKRLNVASAVRSALGDVGDTLSTSRLTKLDQPGDQFVVPSGRIGDGLHASSDVDLYQVQASAGDVLSVALSTPQGGTAVNTVLRIFNSQGVPLASLDDPDSNGAQFQMAVPASGTYYLGVSGGQNSLYNPAVTNSGSNGAVGDYRLDVSLDVGDTISSAKVLTLGTAGTAWQYGAELGDGAHDTKDVDIYRVQLQAQTLFTAYTSPIRAGAAADQVLRLFDANGNLVASSNLANASAVGLQYQVAAGGVFYVGVSGKGNVSYNPTQAGSGTEGIKGDYSLHIESSPIQPSNAAEFNLQSLISADGSQGFVMTGGAPYAELTGGNSVGDVNNDGIDDFVVAVTGDIGIGPKGMVYVVFGKNQQQGLFPSSLDLESLDGTNGYRLEGIELFDRTGLVNGNAGDVNGDGRSDFVIGAIAASPSNDRIDAGQTYVIFGGGLQALDAADGLVDGHILLANLDGIHGFTINSAVAGGLGGRSATAGDVNGDGFGDLIIGAPAVNSSTGAAYVVFGRSSFPSVFELSSLNGTNGFSIPGLATSSSLGVVVGKAGDINGDSLDDFYVGSPSVDIPGMDNAGATYIIFGKSSFGSAGTPAALDLNTIQGTNGFVVRGSTASESFASSVSFVGDFNADGFGDLAIAASGADFEGRSNAGAVYLIYGRNASQNPFPSIILSNTIEAAHGIAIVGAYAEGFMAAVGSGGDVNGDGFSDMIMAAASADPFGIGNAGQTFVVYGSRLTPSRFDLASLLNANGGNGSFGRVFNGFLDGSGMRASIVGDINDDGRDDIRIASPYVDLLGMTAPGQVYMVYGQPSSAGVRVSPSSNMNTSEAGATASFQVVLMTKPSAPVTIPLSVSDGTEGVLSQPSLTFDPSNWNVPQTVVVQGVDDAIVDGPIVYNVVLGIVSSADPLYQGINPSDATITNIDNDFYSTKFYTVDDGTLNQTTEYAFNGSSLDRYSLASANSTPRGATTNGAGSRVWVIDNNRTVYVYDPSGTLLGSWSAGSMPTNAQPEGIATNGTDIWIVDNRNDRIYRYTGAATRLSGSQTAASSFALASGNSNPKDIATDGQSLWVVNDASTDRVYKYSVGGTSQGNWSIDSGNSLPTGIAIDPANVNDLWIADRGANRIYRYSGATTRISGSQTSSSTVQLAVSNTSLQGLVVAPGVPDGQAAAEGWVESATTVDESIEWLAAIGVPSFDPAIGQKEGFDRTSSLGRPKWNVKRLKSQRSCQRMLSRPGKSLRQRPWLAWCPIQDHSRSTREIWSFRASWWMCWRRIWIWDWIISESNKPDPIGSQTAAKGPKHPDELRVFSLLEAIQ